MSAVELSYVSIEYQEPIVYFTYKQGTELGFPEIKELVRYAEKLSGGRPYVTFSDVRVDMNLTEEGKKYVANIRNMPLFRGTAALVKNGMYSFGANFLSYFSKNPYPFRAFVKKEAAIKWLKNLPLD